MYPSLARMFVKVLELFLIVVDVPVLDEPMCTIRLGFLLLFLLLLRVVELLLAWMLALVSPFCFSFCNDFQFDFMERNAASTRKRGDI